MVQRASRPRVTAIVPLPRLRLMEQDGVNAPRSANRTYRLSVDGLDATERIVAPNNAAALRLGVQAVRWWQRHGGVDTGRRLSARLVSSESTIVFEVDRRGRCCRSSVGEALAEDDHTASRRWRGLWPFGRRGRRR